MRKLWMSLVAVALVAAACGSGEEPALEPTPEAMASVDPNSYMAQLQKAGALKVGVKFDIPQFGYLNPETNKNEGFDVDVATEIADALGVKPEFSEAISANRIPFLQTDKVDIIFSTMTINEERKQQIDFSDVYYVAAQSFLSKKGSPITVETAAGKKVCTAKGSTSEQNLPKLQPKVQMTLLDKYGDCFQALRNGQVDAVSTDDVILLQFLKQDPTGFEISAESFSQEPYGAGIKKGRPEFVQFVNDVIRDMKQDGRWEKLYDKWVKTVTGKTATPPPPTVEFKIGK